MKTLQNKLLRDADAHYERLAEMTYEQRFDELVKLIGLNPDILESKLKAAHFEDVQHFIGKPKLLAGVLLLDDGIFAMQESIFPERESGQISVTSEDIENFEAFSRDFGRNVRHRMFQTADLYQESLELPKANEGRNKEFIQKVADLFTKTKPKEFYFESRGRWKKIAIGVNNGILEITDTGEIIDSKGRPKPKKPRQDYGVPQAKKIAVPLTPEEILAQDLTSLERKSDREQSKIDAARATINQLQDKNDALYKTAEEYRELGQVAFSDIIETIESFGEHVNDHFDAGEFLPTKAPNIRINFIAVSGVPKRKIDISDLAVKTEEPNEQLTAFVQEIIEQRRLRTAMETDVGKLQAQQRAIENYMKAEHRRLETLMEMLDKLPKKLALAQARKQADFPAYAKA
ncbi:hypothetical protein N9Z27_00720 [Alphaproteobacteria bacterium]|nr:hypothetical protein [Alphaproteobacteria bacterium]